MNTLLGLGLVLVLCIQVYMGKATGYRYTRSQDG